MINKDLIFALQTRNKKIIRLLEEFANQIDSNSFSDSWKIISETIVLTKELSPTQAKYSHIVKSINRTWIAFGEYSPEAVNKLYDTLVTLLEKTVWAEPSQAQIAYQLINAFHQNNFSFPRKNKHLHSALSNYSDRLLSLIMQLAKYSKQKLFTTPIRPHTGSGKDAIEMLLEIYFYHGGINQSNASRAEAAKLIPLLVNANPEIGNTLTLSLLEYHPERSTVISQLIDVYLAAGVHENFQGMFFGIMLEILDNENDSFIYKDLNDISKQLEMSSKQWSAEQIDSFARYAFFYRLKTDEDRRLLLSKSKKAMRLAQIIIDTGHSGKHIEILDSLYHSILFHDPIQPSIPPVSHQFKDINLKLLVIDELMYVQEKLLPRFDIRQFIRKYSYREIIIPKEGYAIIPEALEYFENLTISATLLAQIEELTFDGGNEIYHHIFPYWEGECDVFDAIYAEDIALLPNLKRMSSMPSIFVDRHQIDLRKKGIELS